jgi:hypothetical protein
MMDYPMCSQYVTIYRKTAEGITRTELPGCYIQWQEEESYDRLGRQTQRKFLLIQPGESQQVFPGDRVLEGVGPEITLTEWPAFTPETVTGLGEVAYAEIYTWQGKFCHTEAGRK